MAWNAKIHRQYGANGDGLAVFDLVHEHLQTLGWSVVGGGDGLLAVSPVGSGPLLTHGGTGVFGLGNQNAWFVIEDPAGRQLRVRKHPSGWTYNYYWSVSPSGSFAGGTATISPTAPDEHGIPADPVDSVAAGFTYDYGINNYFHLIAADAEVNGEWPFHLLKTNAVNGENMGYLAAVALHDVDPGDDCPVIWWGAAENIGVASWANTGRRAKCIYDPAGAASWSICYAGHIFVSSAYRIPGTTGTTPDGIYRTKHIDWWVLVGELYRWKGRSDWIWSPDLVGGSPWNHLWEDQDGVVHLAVNGGSVDGVLIPGWPDLVTCPLPDLGAGVITHSCIVIDAATPGGGITTEIVNCTKDNTDNQWKRWRTAAPDGGAGHPGPGSPVAGSYHTEARRVY